MSFDDYFFILMIIIGIVVLFLVKDLWLKYVIAVFIAIISILKVIFKKENKKENCGQNFISQKETNLKKISKLNEEISSIKEETKKDKKELSDIDKQIEELEKELGIKK